MARPFRRGTEAVPRHDALLRHLFRPPEGPDRDDDSTEYIAPDLLPERNAGAGRSDALWDVEQPTETAEFEFEMLHPGLGRGLICEIGGEAGVAALYWRGGVCAYERTRAAMR